MFRSKEERKAEKEARAKARAAERERHRRAAEAERQREEEQRQREEERKRRRAWEATDHGRAKVAYDAGEMFFQMQRVISATKAEVFIMMGASSTSEEVDKSAQGGAGFMSSIRDTAAASVENLPITQTLAAIEGIGWRLAHAGYTYRETYSESRDKFLASGQQVATSGEIVAIYLFRRVSGQTRTE